jgi:hypothetical protein
MLHIENDFSGVWNSVLLHCLPRFQFGHIIANKKEIKDLLELAYGELLLAGERCMRVCTNIPYKDSK